MKLKHRAFKYALYSDVQFYHLCVRAHVNMVLIPESNKVDDFVKLNGNIYFQRRLGDLLVPLDDHIMTTRLFQDMIREARAFFAGGVASRCL